MNAVETMLTDNPVRRLIQGRRRAPLLLAMTGRLEGKRALEIGCGTGFGMEIILRQFGAESVSGIDIDPALVARARKRIRRYAGRAEVSVADMNAIPAEDESFDAVFDFDSIHHVELWEDALREVTRVLKPGGLFIFEEVSKQALDGWVYRTFFKHPVEDRFTEKDFVAALSRNGIVVDDRLTSFWSGDHFAGVGRRTRQFRLSHEEAIAKIGAIAHPPRSREAGPSGDRSGA